MYRLACTTISLVFLQTTRVLMRFDIELQRLSDVTIITRRVLDRAQLDPVTLNVSASDGGGRLAGGAEIAINAFRPLVAA